MAASCSRDSSGKTLAKSKSFLLLLTQLVKILEKNSRQLNNAWASQLVMYFVEAVDHCGGGTDSTTRPDGEEVL
jgi:hypothetical protein